MISFAVKRVDFEDIDIVALDREFNRFSYGLSVKQIFTGRRSCDRTLVRGKVGIIISHLESPHPRVKNVHT
jgi:hypothetical protein